MIGNIAKHILNNMPFPIWIRDLDKKFIFVNNAFENTYSDYEGIESIAKCVCKKCSIKGICDNKIKKLIESNKKQSFEVKIDKMINQCYINPYFDDNKNIVGVIGILIDITDSKQKQKKIEESESILRTIIDTFPDYIFYKDKECKYIGYNKKWEKHYEKLGITSMIGKNDIEIGAISEELARYFVEQDKEIIKTKNPITKEHKAIDENGKVIIQETKKVPVINEHGEILGIVGLSSDVSEKIELKEKLIKLSYTDSLTEIFNRACFEEKKEELNKKENLPIGVIMGDVNGLKVVNDTFGHLEGDRLLKYMANVLKKVTSEKDYIFRWGGDEFVILIPNCNEIKCENIIKSIMKECKNSNFNLINMSISMGASIKDNLEQNIYDNLKEAEEKLYRQKFLSEKSIRSSIIFSMN